MLKILPSLLKSICTLPWLCYDFDGCKLCQYFLEFFRDALGNPLLVAKMPQFCLSSIAFRKSVLTSPQLLCHHGNATSPPSLLHSITTPTLSKNCTSTSYLSFTTATFSKTILLSALHVISTSR